VTVGRYNRRDETEIDRWGPVMTRYEQEASVEAAVARRYAAAARAVEPALCCAVEYDPALLAVIPDEVIQRDYGCGDPSRHVREGEVVLDLGSGSGKTCFIASQVVGCSGRVFGVDANDEMLALARGARQDVAEAIGYDNVRFLKGRIQDLSLDLERLDQWLAGQTISDLAGWQRMEEAIRGWRLEQPLVADQSIDIVVSNCVLNLVHPGDRRKLFGELARVLKPGGRAVISDIVADNDVPDHLQQDLALWSGCVSGAYREDRFLEAFAGAGMVGVEVVQRQPQPWAVVEGVEFRSVTVRAMSPQVPAQPTDRIEVTEILPPDESTCCEPGEECC